MNDIKIINYFFLLLLFQLLSFSDTALNGHIDEKYNKAAILIDEEHYEEALTLYNEILKNISMVDNFKKSRIFNNIGYCYYKLDNLQSALNFYKKALEIDDNYLICLNNLSALLINKKKYREAILYLEKAYQMDKENIKVIFNLFIVNYSLQNKEYASRYLKEAFNINEEYTTNRLKKHNISKKDIKKLKKYLNIGKSPTANSFLHD